MDKTAQLGVMAGIIIPLALFAMIFGVVYLSKRERMAMIERGMDPRRYKPQSAPFQTLKWGLLLIGAGTASLEYFEGKIFVKRIKSQEPRRTICIPVLVLGS